MAVTMVPVLVEPLVRRVISNVAPLADAKRLPVECLDSGTETMVMADAKNDLADDEEPAVRKNLARGIGQINRALDAVTKPKLLP